MICSATCVRGIELAGEDVPVHQVDEHISALDDVAVDLGEQPLRPGHPAAADAVSPLVSSTRASQNAHAHRGKRVTGVEVELVGALQRLDAIVAPAERGTRRWQGGRSRPA